MAAATSTPRRSTPARRARSSSVASNTSRASSRAPNSARKSTAATTTPSKKESTTSTPKKTSTPRASSAKKASAASARPALPEEKNPKLPGEPVQVKLQTIKREEQSIIIGRVKLETVNGADHGFLLKRFDTNAVAASSMFRLAFPYADGEAERLEMAYLDRKFDTDRANGGMISKPKRGRPKKGAADDDKAGKVLPEGSTGVRLQGTWLPCEDALEIAEEYGLALYAKPLIDAKASTVDGIAHLVNDSARQAPSTPAKGASKPESADGTPSSNRKRQRTSKAAAAAADATPSKADATAASPKTSAARSRSKKTPKADGTEEVTHTKTTTSIEAAAGLTQAQIDEQIKKSQALAKEVQAASSGKSTQTSRKRRASNDRPTADLDVLADDDSVSSNFVSRPLRRAGRVVRRRPVATAAGTMGAVAAAGVGALAWFAGGNLDVAQQILQQGFTQLQGFFF